MYLIDRQPFDWSLQRWLGASDLARLMIIPWRPELRRDWQIPVLQRYQETLRRAGIELPWQLLLADYRLAALESVEIAVEWCADPVTRVEKRGLWEWMLGRALEAVDDLDCAALLQSRSARKRCGVSHIGTLGAPFVVDRIDDDSPSPRIGDDRDGREGYSRTVYSMPSPRNSVTE
ncbi:MAG TPA: hypothetical protein VJ829_10550, partial [Candidatus Binatia bacterium]|nr:hypothetical protein [Candidatus Binatia bacterium]